MILSFDRQCQLSGLPVPVPEYVFAKPRRWRFDWAFVAHKLAVEQEGGVWTKGRHTRGAGYLSDCQKYNEAVTLGWRVLRYTPVEVRSGVALAGVERVLRMDTVTHG